MDVCGTGRSGGTRFFWDVPGMCAANRETPATFLDLLVSKPSTAPPMSTGGAFSLLLRHSCTNCTLVFTVSKVGFRCFTSISRLCMLDHLLVMILTEGAYSTWLPYASDVTRSWQKCGRRLGPSCDLILVMHSTTAEDSWGLPEYAVAKRNSFARARELAVSDAA